MMLLPSSSPTITPKQNQHPIQRKPQTKHYVFHALELRPCRFRHGDPHARPDGPPTLLEPPAARRTCPRLRPPSFRPSLWSGLSFTRLLTVLVEYVWSVVFFTDDVLYLQTSQIVSVPTEKTSKPRKLLRHM